MRHRILTCRNHPNLRWSCKEIAWTEDEKGGYYNSSRNIFFNGEPSGKGMYFDGSGLDCTTYVTDPSKGGPRFVEECKCPAGELILAPEDKDVAQ